MTFLIDGVSARLWLPLLRDGTAPFGDVGATLCAPSDTHSTAPLTSAELDLDPNGTPSQ